MNFINDASPLKNQVPTEFTGTKSTYTPQSMNSNNSQTIDALLFNIKAQIKKERIRLGEFFLDHDLLRKGNVPVSKFRGVLNA